MTILIENLSKRFDNIQALHHIYLEIEKHAIVALVGGSGSGKSTLLRMIAGLDTPDEGSIWIKGCNAAFMSVQERKIGFVSQSYALFQHMTVYDNIAFSLHVKKESLKHIDEKVKDLLNLIELNNLYHYFPSQLSGGQRQRVALARALATGAEILLLDEPFAALDMRMRKDLRDWLRNLHKQSSVTIVFVTHDYKEALEVASDIIMLKAGHLEQLGKPEDFYNYFLSKRLL